MNTMTFKDVLLLLLFLFFTSACGNRSTGKLDQLTNLAKNTYTNPLLPEGSDPSAVFHNGKYYYIHGTEDKIMLWETSDITDLKHATCKVVWRPKDPSNSFHIWGPEIHYIKGKWYIYYTADDGNTDNHQLYVLENASLNPMNGSFQMKGRIVTDLKWNWGILASVFENKGKLYLLWSGWPRRRIYAENQCIYIAGMKNPWTIDSPRVLISKPDHEWERQWVNPDGTRTAYPIYVNEGPQYFHSKDYKKVIVYYAASGSWTPYYCVGMLTADANSNLLNPSSWKKKSVPVFRQSPENDVYGPGGISFIPSPDGTEWYILYHARQVTNGDAGSRDTRSPRLQKIGWDAQGMPDLGVPVRIGTVLSKPSGTIK